jgi:hypothetical protein
VGRPLSWSSRNTPHVVSLDSRPLPSITSLCAHTHVRESRAGQCTWRVDAHLYCVLSCVHFFYFFYVVLTMVKKNIQ